MTGSALCWQFLPSLVIPFDKSKLLNKDATLVSTLASATLQFLPEIVKRLGKQISSDLLTRFDYSQAYYPDLDLPMSLDLKSPTPALSILLTLICPNVTVYGEI